MALVLRAAGRGLEALALGLKHTETCLRDVGEGCCGLPSDPLRGFPVGGREINL